MFISTLVLVMTVLLTIREWRRVGTSSKATTSSAVLMTVIVVMIAVFWFFTFKNHNFSFSSFSLY